MARLLVALAVSLVLVACTGAATTVPATAPPSEPLITDAPPSDEPTATPDLVTSLATGAWRRKAVEAPQGFATLHDAGCRAAEPGIGALPLAVIDLRGEELMTLVYGDMTAGYVCWTMLPTPDAPLEVRALTVTPGAPDGIDIALYESVDLDGAVRTFMLGRVGPMSQPRTVLGDQNPAFVIAGFTDETFVWGAFDNSWYAMWWPGNDEADGVAITNGRNEVLDSALDEGG